MASSGVSLPPRRQRAIIALLEHPTINEAAQAAGIGQRTLSRWLAEDDAFQEALRDAQERATNQAIYRLAGAAPLAANVLSELANDETVSAAVRVQAASKVLSELRQSLQIMTFGDDIARLREIIGELEKRH